MRYNLDVAEGQSPYLVDLTRDLYFLSLVVSQHLEIDLSEFVSRAITREILDTLDNLC